jgi:large conductance mechanosensitive channel
MPVINPILSAAGSDWKNATFSPTSQISIKYGSFLGNLINFLILAFIVFMIAKYIMKEEKVTKK